MPELLRVRMNKRVKSLWLEALRSGRFQRGTGVLRRTYGDGTQRHCCLGVLCELYRENQEKEDLEPLTWREEGEDDWSTTSSRVGVARVPGDILGPEQRCYLPSPVADWAGIEMRGAIGDGESSIEFTLAQINDAGMRERDDYSDVVYYIDKTL